MTENYAAAGSQKRERPYYVRIADVVSSREFESESSDAPRVEDVIQLRRTIEWQQRIIRVTSISLVVAFFAFAGCMLFVYGKMGNMNTHLVTLRGVTAQMKETNREILSHIQGQMKQMNLLAKASDLSVPELYKNDLDAQKMAEIGKNLLEASNRVGTIYREEAAESEI